MSKFTVFAAPSEGSLGEWAELERATERTHSLSWALMGEVDGG